MRLAIVGGRDFIVPYPVFKKIIEQYFDLSTISKVISGGAKGADSMAKMLAETEQLDYIEFPAKWRKHGNKAGMLRNSKIVEACDGVLAFWDGTSKGTADTISKANRYKKPLLVVEYETDEDGNVIWLKLLKDFVLF